MEIREATDGGGDPGGTWVAGAGAPDRSGVSGAVGVGLAQFQTMLERTVPPRPLSALWAERDRVRWGWRWCDSGPVFIVASTPTSPVLSALRAERGVVV